MKEVTYIEYYRRDGYGGLTLCVLTSFYSDLLGKILHLCTDRHTK